MCSFAIRRLMLVSSLWLCGLGTGRAGTTVMYMMMPLTSPADGPSRAYGLNELGQAVGDFNSGHGFLFDGTTTHVLGTLGGTASSAVAINGNGVVVGSSTDGSGATHAFLYDGTMHDLGVSIGTDYKATGINDAGQVVGTYTGLDGRSHGFLYDHGTMTDLDVLSGQVVAAQGINASGQIVGTMAVTTANGTERHAFLSTGSTLQDLGTLGGPQSEARAVNALGQVAGFSSQVTDGILFDRAFLTDATPAHGMSLLGPFPRLYSYSYATAINDAGMVVGYSLVSGERNSLPFLYDGVATIDLNSRLINPTAGTLIEANAINDAGQIVGTALYNGVPRAVMLTPRNMPNSEPDPATAPEPATLLGGLLGVAIVVFHPRTRRRS